MIKIIHVLSDTNIGGAGIWILNYLKAFDRGKYSVSVALPPDSALKTKILKLNIPVFEINNTQDKSFSRQAIGEFKRLFESEKPDIVHTHASLSARIAAKRLKIKTVNTRHCLEDKKQFLKKILFALVNNSLSDAIIGVSKATCKNLLDEGIKKDKVKLLYNGVIPPERLDIEKRQQIKTKLLNIPPDSTVIGMIARLESVKNHKLFLETAQMLVKRHKNVTFVIVGGGSLEFELRDYAKTLKIADNVIFTGRQSDICDFINVIDIMALTSKKEALSLSLIEGMYLAIPSVATASGGPDEVIDDGKTGFLVKNDDTKALSDAFSKLIEDKKLRHEMGENAKKRAQTLFGIENMLSGLDKIYEEL